MLHHFDGFPNNAPPMAILSAMINALGCFQPEIMQPEDNEHFMQPAARLMSKVRTIAAASYRKSIGRPVNYPRTELRYTANFLHMMFSLPHKLYQPDEVVVRALDQLLLLHADHEQNCSTSTVRMVGSSQANLHASVAAGVCALWGPLHGGANVAVIEMLTQLQDSGEKLDAFVARVKDKDAHARLMGFGHRVYKNFDPRARIIKDACHALLKKLGVNDPLLEIAMRLEEVALARRVLRQAQAVSQRRLLQRHHHARARHPDEHVHRDVRDRPLAGLDRALARGSRRRNAAHRPAAPDLHRRDEASVRSDGAAQVAR